jgi:hypothetical protein
MLYGLPSRFKPTALLILFILPRQRAERCRPALLTCAVIGSSACTASPCLRHSILGSKSHLTCWKYLPGGLGGGERPPRGIALLVAAE